MATQIMRTNRRTYNHNPQGSATAVVTTAGDNPFERNVSLKTNSMLPSMGMAGLGAEAEEPKPETSEWLRALQTGLTTIGLTAISQEVLKPPQAAPLPAAQPISLTAPGSYPVPPANTVSPYPIRQSMVPQPGGTMKMLPWAIAGGTALLIGGVFFATRKKKK